VPSAESSTAVRVVAAKATALKLNFIGHHRQPDICERFLFANYDPRQELRSPIAVTRVTPYVLLGRDLRLLRFLQLLAVGAGLFLDLRESRIVDRVLVFFQRIAGA
jgi:hypothetical protein